MLVLKLYNNASYYDDILTSYGVCVATATIEGKAVRIYLNI